MTHRTSALPSSHFVDHSNGCRLKWTPLGLVTIINYYSISMLHQVTVNQQKQNCRTRDHAHKQKPWLNKMYLWECRSQCTKKAERMKKVFTSSLVYFRFVLWRIKLLSTCSRARITSMQIWLRLSFQNHHIHKSQCVCVILFAWNRTSNCDQKKLFREYIRL